MSGMRDGGDDHEEAIRNNPDNEPFFDAICASRVALFDAIRSILTDEQVVIWDQWVLSLDGRCYGG